EAIKRASVEHALERKRQPRRFGEIRKSASAHEDRALQSAERINRHEATLTRETRPSHILRLKAAILRTVSSDSPMTSACHAVAFRKGGSSVFRLLLSTFYFFLSSSTNHSGFNVTEASIPSPHLARRSWTKAARSRRGRRRGVGQLSAPSASQTFFQCKEGWI